MRFVLSKEIDYDVELLLLLDGAGAARLERGEPWERGLRAFSAHCRRSLGLGRAQADAWFGPLLEIEKHVLRGLALDARTICRDYTAPEAGLTPPATFAAQLRGVELSEERLAGLIYASAAEADLDDAPPELAFPEFVRRLGALPLDPDHRWTLVELAADWPRRRAELEAVLDRGAALLREREALAAPLVDAWYDALSARLSREGGVLPSLSAKLPEGEYLVRPLLMGCNLISTQLNLRHWPELGGGRSWIGYGVLCDELEALRKEKQDDPEVTLLDDLRVLGDKQRLRIMAALLERPRYASDIAKLTGLAAPTVTHHMQELLSARLARAEIEGGRVRYFPDPEGCAGLSRSLAAFLQTEAEHGKR